MRRQPDRRRHFRAGHLGSREKVPVLLMRPRPLRKGRGRRSGNSLVLVRSPVGRGMESSVVALEGGLRNGAASAKSMNLLQARVRTVPPRWLHPSVVHGMCGLWFADVDAFLICLLPTLLSGGARALPSGRSSRGRVQDGTRRRDGKMQPGRC